MRTRKDEEFGGHRVIVVKGGGSGGEGDSDNVTMKVRITCAMGGKKYLQTVRHNTLKIYARRCEWKMHLQGPWPVSRFFRRALFLGYATLARLG